MSFCAYVCSEIACSCHLALGELEAAASLYKDCIAAAEGSWGSAGAARGGDEAEVRHAKEGLEKVLEVQACSAKVKAVLLLRRKAALSSMSPLSLGDASVPAPGAPGAAGGGVPGAGPGGVPLDAADLARAEPEALLKRVTKALGPALLSEELLQLKAELLLWVSPPPP